MLSSVALSVRIRGRRHKLEHRRLSELQEALLYSVDDGAPAVQRACGVLMSFEMSEAAWIRSGWPCSCRGLAGDLQMSLPTSQPFCDSVLTSQVPSVQNVCISLFSWLPFSIFFFSSSSLWFVFSFSCGFCLVGFLLSWSRFEVSHKYGVCN